MRGGGEACAQGEEGRRERGELKMAGVGEAGEMKKANPSEGMGGGGGGAEREVKQREREREGASERERQRMRKRVEGGGNKGGIFRRSLSAYGGRKLRVTA